MNARLIFRIARTELAALFFSPIAWLLLVAFACQVGIEAEKQAKLEAKEQEKRNKELLKDIEKKNLQENVEKNTGEVVSDALAGAFCPDKTGIKICVMCNQGCVFNKLVKV